MKDTLRLLLEKYHSDSKKESEEAEKKIIDICKPIVKKFYKIASLFGLRISPFDGDYVPNRGRFVSIAVSPNNKEIYLKYCDSYMGDFFDDTIIMPVNWVSNTEYYLKLFFEKCQEMKLAQILKNINNQEQEIKKLKASYLDIKNMDFSNIKSEWDKK